MFTCHGSRFALVDLTNRKVHLFTVLLGTLTGIVVKIKTASLDFTANIVNSDLQVPVHKPHTHASNKAVNIRYTPILYPQKLITCITQHRKYRLRVLFYVA